MKPIVAILAAAKQVFPKAWHFPFIDDAVDIINGYEVEYERIGKQWVIRDGYLVEYAEDEAPVSDFGLEHRPLSRTDQHNHYDVVTHAGVAQLANNYSWHGAVRVTPTIESTIRPDGTVGNVGKLMQTATNGTHDMAMATLTHNQWASYMNISLFIKPININYICIKDTVGYNFILDLSDGSVVSSTQASFVLCEALANGWFYIYGRLWENIGGIGANPSILQFMAESDPVPNQSFLGDTSRGVYVYGASSFRDTLVSGLPSVARYSPVLSDISAAYTRQRVTKSAAIVGGALPAVGYTLYMEICLLRPLDTTEGYQAILASYTDGDFMTATKGYMLLYVYSGGVAGYVVANAPACTIYTMRPDVNPWDVLEVRRVLIEVQEGLPIRFEMDNTDTGLEDGVVSTDMDGLTVVSPFINNVDVFGVTVEPSYAVKNFKRINVVGLSMAEAQNA